MLTRVYLNTILEYNPETGIFVWIVSRANNRICIGDQAGTVDSDGYRSIMHDGKRYKEHRLAFLYMTGEFPLEQVDHINHDKADNRWENLRPATSTENSYNKKKNANNTSGFKGVSFHKSTRRWRMRISYTDDDGNNQRIYRSFNTPEEASASYDKFSKELHGKFRCNNT